MIIYYLSKVRKLTKKAGVATEPLLSWLPIITGYGWCVGGRSLELRRKA